MSDSQIKMKKLLFVGDKGVGKTTILTSLADKEEVVIPTIGIDCTYLYGRNLKLLCWDLSGEPSLHFMLKDFCKIIDTVVIVCRADDANSVESINHWYNKVRAFDSDLNIILMVNNFHIHSSIPLKTEISKNFNEILYVSDPLSIEQTKRRLLFVDEPKKQNHHLLNKHDEDYFYPNIATESPILSFIKKELSILLKERHRYFFKPAPKNEALLKIFSEICRGALTNIDEIIEALHVIKEKRVIRLIASIEQRIEYFSLAPVELTPSLS